MLHFPPAFLLQEAQPLVLHGGEIFVKTRRQRCAAALVTALGVIHPLRSFCPVRTLTDQLRRVNAPAVHRLLEQELARCGTVGGRDALTYVVEELAPRFGARDWEEDYDEEPGTLARAAGGNPVAEPAELCEQLPLPELPEPSLWLLGRLWRLRPGSARAGPAVLVGGQTLEAAGEPLAVGTLHGRWQEAVQRFLSAVAARLARQALGPRDPVAVGQARQQLERDGFWGQGDLLLLPPATLGYVLPTHYNAVLHRQSNRDLAVAAALGMPAGTSPLLIYLRSGGRWERYLPPNGICLGGGPPPIRPPSPGLALAAYLRWVAFYLAANGRFHASDR